MSEQPYQPRRSLIFAPGNQPEMIPKALKTGSDIVCVDLEDAIAPQHKAEAREKTLGFFATPQAADGVERIVRINCLRTEEGLRDVLQACARIDSLLFGGVDMAADLRVEPTWEALLYARRRVVHAAAGAGVDAIDVPFLDLKDMDGLTVAAAASAEIGFTGKASIHPKQIPVINAAFSPTEAQLDRAQRIVDAFAQQDSGLLVVDGELIEKPVLRSMQRLLAIAERTGRAG
jgi:citrate lyase beta subunit